MALPSAFTSTLSGPSISGTRNLSASKKYSGDTEDGKIVTLAAGAANIEKDIVIAFADIQLLYIMATGGDITIFTNSNDGTGGDQIDLKDGWPTVFAIDGPNVNPLTNDVTALFLNNANGVPVQFDLYVLTLSA